MKRGVAVAALLLSAAITGPGSAAQSPGAPSFSCKGRLSATEAAICKDAELAAWDRAMARIHPLVDKEWQLPPARQQEWLKQRDACGANRPCILRAYREWPGFDAGVAGIGTEFLRQGNDESNWAGMEILPIHGGWHYFSITAWHVRNAETGAVHDGMASGLVHVEGAGGSYDQEPGMDSACRLHFRRIDARRWSVQEFGRNTICGGMGIDLSGDYVRSAVGDR